MVRRDIERTSSIFLIAAKFWINCKLDNVAIYLKLPEKKVYHKENRGSID